MQGQAGQLFEIASLFRSFVGRVVRAKAAPRQARPSLFVVPIDDVDLQVGRLPELLHAVRLLYHPSVVYILTGNRAHLRDVVELDYLRQHLHMCHAGFALTDEASHALFEQASSHARKLANALVNKYVPEHSTFEVPLCSVKDALDFKVGSGTTVAGILDSLPRSKPKDAELTLSRVILGNDLCNQALAPVRTVQQAIDRHDPTEQSDAGQLATAFFQRITGEPRGRLTTIRTDSRAWSGTSVSATVRIATSGPRLALFPDRNDDGDVLRRADLSSAPNPPRRTGLTATHALLVALARELDYDEHSHVQWEPDAGFVWTEGEWPLGESRMRVVFHWPWLTRPRASTLYQNWGVWCTAQKALEREMETPGGSGRQKRAIDKVLVETWIDQNLRWNLRNGVVAKEAFRLGKGRWRVLERQWAPRLNSEAAAELARWRLQLRLMSRSYFGLHEDVRKLLARLTDGATARQFALEEDQSVSTALTVESQERGDAHDPRIRPGTPRELVQASIKLDRARSRSAGSDDGRIDPDARKTHPRGKGAAKRAGAVQKQK